MDPVTAFLDGPRARRAFLLRVVMARPWCLDVADRVPLTVVAQLTGESWLQPPGGPAGEDGLLHLEPGDVVVIADPRPYRISDGRTETAIAAVGPGQTCTGPGGRDLSTAFSTGLRSWGNDVAGPDSLLVGSYGTEGEVGRLLLAALPETFVVRAGDDPLLRVLAAELGRDELGQSSVLDRLLDLVLVGTVRRLLTEPVAQTWLGAARDPQIGRAVQLLHARPEHPWTVGGLAAAVGVSRAVFARRFHDLVGLPPMTYLTRWRLAVGADLLQDPTSTLAGISRQVGYGNAFSFSAAFKRQYGHSPQEHRRASA